MTVLPEPAPAQKAASRLTAWALNELPAPESAAFEAGFWHNPEGASEARDTRAFCQMMEAQLRQPGFRLNPEIRGNLKEAARRISSPRFSFLAPGLAAAACFALMTAVVVATRRWNSPNQEAFLPPTASPNLVALNFNMGKFYFDLGDAFQAEKYLRQVLTLDPGHDQARRLLAWGNLERRQYLQASGQLFSPIDQCSAQSVIEETSLPLSSKSVNSIFAGIFLEDSTSNWRLNSKGETLGWQPSLTKNRVYDWRAVFLPGIDSQPISLCWMDPNQSPYRTRYYFSAYQITEEIPIIAEAPEITGRFSGIAPSTPTGLSLIGKAKEEIDSVSLLPEPP